MSAPQYRVTMTVEDAESPGEALSVVTLVGDHPRHLVNATAVAVDASLQAHPALAATVVESP